MFDKLGMTDDVRAILRLAEEEARSFRHEYIGTEHLLLGLLREGDGVGATVLSSHGIDLAKVCHEIDQLVQYGQNKVTQTELPLTPRARQALDFAAQYAFAINQSLIDTGHLFLGLCRETEGVAGLVLRKLGFDIIKSGDEVLKIRLLQMKIVERVVRPLRAHINRKRKIRDELLAHLSAIYDEELARCESPEAAVAASSKRFGDSKELTAELQATVPRLERWEAAGEPLFGWHPPETGTRWMWRMALQMSGIMLVMLMLAAFFALREFGWGHSAWLTLRPIAAAAIVLPISVAMSGICHFKMRDYIFGVFGSRKSWGRAFAWTALLAVVTVACGFTFLSVAYGSISPATAAFYPNILAGIIWAFCTLASAKIFGLQEIRDATWALLDLKEKSLEA